MAKPENLIAVFDSGQGGISVLRELVRQMPREHFLYYGDSANAPYGSRPTQQVRELTLQRVEELMQRGLKAIVIACNTATGATIDELRSRYPDTIVIGIEPALKLAAEQSPKGRIVVMATEVTLREKKYAALMERYQDSHDIVPLPSPRIVEFVERGVLDGPEPEAYLRETLLPCLNADTRAIVLGCTHFPFMRPLISRLAGPNIQIYDGGEGTAAHTRRRLQQENLLLSEGKGSVTIENSLPDPGILALSQMLLHLGEDGL